ncbi:MAG: hypothetical protein RIF41_31135, partial [Polyangiaceae bacterium]
AAMSLRPLWGVLVGVVCVACGGRSSTELYCEEFGACFDRVNPETPIGEAGIDECVDELDAQLDRLSAENRERVGEFINDCDGNTGCGFVVCICDRIELEDDFCDDARAAQ